MERQKMREERRSVKEARLAEKRALKEQRQAEKALKRAEKMKAKAEKDDFKKMKVEMDENARGEQREVQSKYENVLAAFLAGGEVDLGPCPVPSAETRKDIPMVRYDTNPCDAEGPDMF